MDQHTDIGEYVSNAYKNKEWEKIVIAISLMAIIVGIFFVLPVMVMVKEDENFSDLLKANNITSVQVEDTFNRKSFTCSHQVNFEGTNSNQQRVRGSYCNGFFGYNGSIEIRKVLGPASID